MSVIATSPVAIAKAGLRRLVASSTTFQDVVGASNEASALEKVYIAEAVDDPDELDTARIKDLRPRCMVDMSGLAVPLVGVGETNDQYEFTVSFEFPPPACVTAEVEGEHLADESTWFDNKWSGVVEDMKTNNGGANADSEGYFFFTSIELADGPMRNNPDEDPMQQYYWGVALVVRGPHD